MQHFTHYVGKESCFLRTRWVIVSIHEDILASAMSVEITEQSERSLLRKLLPQSLHTIHLSVEQLRRILISSVEITASQRAAVVTMDHSIHIDHRHYFEHKALSQRHGLLSLAH